MHDEEKYNFHSRTKNISYFYKSQLVKACVKECLRIHMNIEYCDYNNEANSINEYQVRYAASAYRIYYIYERQTTIAGCCVQK